MLGLAWLATTYFDFDIMSMSMSNPATDILPSTPVELLTTSTHRRIAAKEANPVVTIQQSMLSR